MPGLKFTLSDVTSPLPDNLYGPKKIIFRSEVITGVHGNEQLQMVFTTEEF